MPPVGSALQKWPPEHTGAPWGVTFTALPHLPQLQVAEARSMHVLLHTSRPGWKPASLPATGKEQSSHRATQRRSASSLGTWQLGPLETSREPTQLMVVVGHAAQSSTQVPVAAQGNSFLSRDAE